MNNGDLITLKNVSIKYPKSSKIVIQEFNLSIQPNDVIAIVGKSGSGKTTLLKSFFDRALIAKGSYFFKQKNLLLLKKRDFQKLIRKYAFMNQEIQLIPHESVFQNIKSFYPLKRKNFWNFFNLLTTEQKFDIALKLEELGIFEKIFQPVDQLSGGQKQRVEICKILVQKPLLILADEPTASLDLDNSKKIISLLAKTAKKYVIPLIFTTHNHQLLNKFVTKIIKINNQQLTVEIL